MEQTRDLARTREHILQAARAEFAAHGLNGARCDAIARRAGVNKRMLFYCFGSKEKLYRAILGREFAARAAFFEAAPDDLAGAILHWYEAGARDLEWVRLLEWEALSASGEKLVGEDERRAYLKRAFARLQRVSAAGRIPAGLDVAQLHLSIIALTLFPLAFPQMTRLATGLAPTDPRFHRRRLKFLRWLGTQLAPAGAASAAKPQARPRTPRRSAR
jgi:TetR/AcrR family transcriptional regulator